MAAPLGRRCIESMLIGISLLAAEPLWPTSCPCPCPAQSTGTRLGTATLSRPLITYRHFCDIPTLYTVTNLVLVLTLLLRACLRRASTCRQPLGALSLALPGAAQKPLQTDPLWMGTARPLEARPSWGGGGFGLHVSA